MRIGAFDLGQEYRGAPWGIAIYIIPGSVVLGGLLLLLPADLSQSILFDYDKHSVLGATVLIFARNQM